MESREEEDRLSALPDPLIHHIFSYLDMIEILQTPILSKRWRHLWLSTPVLNFDRRTRMSPQTYWIEDKSFTGFVTNVLIRGEYDRNNNILKFDLYSDQNFIDADRLLLWLVLLLKRNVQQLHIKSPLDNDSGVELIHTLFTSSIKDLKLHFTSCSPAPARLPSTMCTAAGITSLDLHLLEFPGGDDHGHLVFTYPLLRVLKLGRCFVGHLKVVAIHAPVLQSLDCDHFRIEENHTAFDFKLRVFAPNLKSLVVKQDFFLSVEYCIEGNLSALVSTEIDVVSDEGRYGYYYDKDAFSMTLCNKRMLKILPPISNVQVLSLSVCCIMAITDCPGLLGRLPYLFPNLKHVKLINWYRAPGVDAVLNFLERLPRIETLVWERISKPWHYQDNWGAKDKGEDWGTNLPFQNIFNSLITFELCSFEGGKVELNFLAFLLEKAILLKKMIIKYNPSLSSEELAEFSEKLSSLPRASSSALILFQLGS